MFVSFCGFKVTAKEANYKGGLYDYSEAVVELDETYKCFSDKSRYFTSGKYDKTIAKDMAFRYGHNLMMEYAKSDRKSVV